MGYHSEFNRWKNALKGDEYAKEIEKIDRDELLKQDSFYKQLEFGTAGMRGVIALGTNRMNIFTVRRATCGLAEYINAERKSADGVVIAYDSRIMSGEFAKQSALTLCQKGVKTYLFDTVTCVPILSFSVRQLKCAAGIMITASHNPPEYNGYKVYGSDGGQLANESADAVTDYIDRIEDPFQIEIMDEEAAVKAGLLSYVGAALYDEYLKRVHTLVLNEKIVADQADQLKVVYTPLHGTGLIPVTRALQNIGIKNVYVVEKQSAPDGRFPTVKVPNPEEASCYELAIALAREKGANIILATDPDCDRLGVAVADESGDFSLLTGNQIGCLLLDYILMQRAHKVKDGFAVKSIVSTPMADEIAHHYGVEMRSVLTGFKYIAEQIELSLEEGKGSFLFGFEESYGFLAGTFVRDKDAAIAAMLTVQAACYYAARRMTLKNALNELYEKYGYHKEDVMSVTLTGADGIARIARAVKSLREKRPQHIGPFDVKFFYDYHNQIKENVLSGETQSISLPKSDVLRFEMQNTGFIIRPSGTEPKLKSYIFACGKTPEQTSDAFNKLKTSVTILLDSLIK